MQLEQKIQFIIWRKFNMFVVKGNVNSGKTMQILNRSAETNTPIFCKTEYEKKELLVRADSLGLKIPVPVVFNSVKQYEEVLIDDPIKLIESLFGCKVVGYSLET